MSEIGVILSATVGLFIGKVLGKMLIKWIFGKDDNDD